MLQLFLAAVNIFWIVFPTHTVYFTWRATQVHLTTQFTGLLPSFLIHDAIYDQWPSGQAAVATPLRPNDTGTCSAEKSQAHSHT